MSFLERYPSTVVFFLITFVVLHVLVGRTRWAHQRLERLGGFAMERAFPYAGEQEVFKFALARIALGMVLLWRAVNMFDLLPMSELTEPVGIVLLLEMVAALMLVFGVFTQYVLIYCMVFSWQAGEVFMTSATLGNDVAAMLSILLLMAQAGRVLSVDGWWISRGGSGVRAFLLYPAQLPSREANGLAKLVALFAYWVLCVYSLAVHLNEPAWMSGLAGPLLLTNNFMSPVSEWFVLMFEESPLAVGLARASLWVMMIWYAVVLPFVLLGGWWRRYVIVWGVLFFLFSLFILDLGSLAEIEFILWAALFWGSVGVSRSSRLLVFFDDRCNLCDRTVQVVSALDVFGVVRLMPASRHQAELAQHGISFEQAMEDLYGVDAASGRIASGYDFYLALSRRVVLLWPVWPILLLGRWSGIGPRVYRFIAERRRALFGVCELGRPKITRYEDLLPDKVMTTTVKAVSVHAFVLGWIFFFGIPAPYLGIDGYQNTAKLAARIYGIAPINVFNQTDLQMAENWFVLRSADAGRLIPVFNEEGERMEYHRSDRIYFGNTLQFRRREIGSTDCSFERQQQRIEYLARVWLDEVGMVPTGHRFLYRQYRQPLPDWNTLLGNRYVRQPRTEVCSVEFTVDPPGSSVKLPAEDTGKKAP